MERFFNGFNLPLTSGEANEGSKARTTLGGPRACSPGKFLNFKCPERPFPAI